MHPRATELIRRLGLAPHPEGGFFREIYRSPSLVHPADGRAARSAITTIFFLLVEGQFSRWHGVASDEVWHLYEGGPLELLITSPRGDELRRIRLGPVAEGVQPTYAVPPLYWQAVRPLAPYALAGCSVGPGFAYEDFRFLADDADALARLRATAPDLAAFV